jgi:hypothetical protein
VVPLSGCCKWWFYFSISNTISSYIHDIPLLLRSIMNMFIFLSRRWWIKHGDMIFLLIPCGLLSNSQWLFNIWSKRSFNTFILVQMHSMIWFEGCWSPDLFHSITTVVLWISSKESIQSMILIL